MAEIASRPPWSQRVRRSLSAKLLVLTVCFVLLAELVVMVPSIAKRRMDWLNERIEAAWLVGLALSGEKGEMIMPEEARELFATANIEGVMFERDGAQVLVHAPTADLERTPIRKFVDLRSSPPTGQIAAAWETLLSKDDSLIQVGGRARYAENGRVDILVSRAALRRDLADYAGRILTLSLFISSITAGLVYASLNRIIVRPVRILSRNMMHFEANPEDPDSVLTPSAREDEIGIAERSLAAMERRTQSLLAERRRLAALGAGVSKISHDLRNILASAQLISDRLAKSEDPRVRKLNPRLIASLDRAITLSRDTLIYARMEPAGLKKSTISVDALVEEVFDDTAALGIAFTSEIEPGQQVYADAGQLYRALFNLVRNSVEALRPQPENTAINELNDDTPIGKVTIRSMTADGRVVIDVVDTGPGIPDSARAVLLEPFKGSTKPGGSGLGVAIAAEIVRAHGGDLILLNTGPDGTTLRLMLPHLPQ